MHYAQGSQYLAEQARVAMRNPSPSSLSEYQGAYSEYLPDALNSVSEPVARRIRSDLDRSYYHYYNQLANAVDDRNRQVLQQDFSASTDAALKSMSSYLFGGDKDNAKLVRDNLLERQAASFESLQLTDAERTAYVDKIDLVYQQSELVGELHQLHERGKDAEVRSRLSELAELPPTEENLSLTKAAMTYVSNYEGAKASQYQLNYLRAQTDLASGDGLDAVLGRYELRPDQHQQLILSDFKAAGSQNKLNILTASMSEDFGNAVLMSSYSGADVDAVYNNLLAQSGDNSITMGAKIANTVKRPIPTFISAVEAAARYGTPEQIGEASGVINMLSANNPQALKGLDKQAMAVSKLYNALSQGEYTPEKAADYAKELVYSRNQDERDLRMDEYAKKFKSYGLNDPVKIRKKVGQYFDARGLLQRNYDIPGDLVADFQALMPEFYSYTGDWDKAKELTVDVLSQTYFKTRINGNREVMKNAPDALGVPQADLVRSVKQLTKANDGVGSEIYNPTSIGGIVQDYPLEMEVNGKAREIRVRSDAITSASQSGMPSWGIYYVDDYGQELPVFDAILGRPARWVPDIESINKRPTRQDILNTELEEFSFQEQIKDLDKYRNLPYER